MGLLAMSASQVASAKGREEISRELFRPLRGGGLPRSGVPLADASPSLAATPADGAGGAAEERSARALSAADPAAASGSGSDGGEAAAVEAAAAAGDALPPPDGDGDGEDAGSASRLQLDVDREDVPEKLLDGTCSPPASVRLPAQLQLARQAMRLIAGADHPARDGADDRARPVLRRK